MVDMPSIDELFAGDSVIASEDEVKKRIGRPPGSKNRPRDETDVETVDFAEDRPKRRGRPPGKSKTDFSGIETILSAIYGAIALYTEIPEIALEKEEADNLGESTGKFFEAHKIKVSGKAGATIVFVLALGAINFPRGMMLYAKYKKPKSVSNDPIANTAPAFGQ